MDKQEEARVEARKILDSFAKSIAKVKVKVNNIKEVEGGYREEGNDCRTDKEFRDLMFENAPNKDDNNIIAEKKQW